MTYDDDEDGTIVDHDLTTASVRLTRDMRNAAKTMGEEEARFMVDMFETKQRDRIRSGNRIAAMDKSEEPHSLIGHFHNLDKTMEAQIGAALTKYCENNRLGQWMIAQKGVGPLIAARLIAFVDWKGSNTPSRIWRFAGLVPGVEWKKGEKRPWNARLKRICYLLGESFVKCKGRDDAFYSDHFFEKKKVLWHRNISGGNAIKAALAKDKVGKTTDAYRWMNGDVIADVALLVANGTWPKEKKPWADEPGSGVPMLPPAQIHAQSRRWTVKLFLAHAWEMSIRFDGEWEKRGMTPYAIDKLDHRDIISPPPG